MTSLSNEIKKLLNEKGADLVGVGDITGIEEKEAISKEFHHYTRAVAIGMKLHKFQKPEKVNGALDEHSLMLAYLKENEDITLKLNGLLRDAVKFLRKRKYRCMAIPPIAVAEERKFISALYNLFSHKMAVTMSGLGWVGKNGMVINGEYGPNLIWATILTDAELTPSPPQLESMCGECRLCVTACPVGALLGVNWSRSRGNHEVIDLEKCGNYMAENSYKYGRPVCGICFMACPMGVKKTRKSG
ncbi:MAG: 4Fe-4S binding protein [Nitrospinota bacterium]|nr:4Fe-4S binding protein [Nitrospinota bacterium]